MVKVMYQVYRASVRFQLGNSPPVMPLGLTWRLVGLSDWPVKETMIVV